mmetsp:Transcript_15185/g.43888  ORF Transcript_15185/g.43888 Transcript_15185/m.43888 type:complete len:235 (-) Transcript_15185:570-1274(-)
MSTPRPAAPTPPGPTRSLPTPTVSSPLCSAPSCPKRPPQLPRWPSRRTMFPSTARISTRKPTTRSPSVSTSTTRSPMRAMALPRPVPPSTRPPTQLLVLIRPPARPPAMPSRAVTLSTSAGRIPTLVASRLVTGRIAVASRPPPARCSPSTRSATCTPRRAGPTSFGRSTCWAGRSMGCSPGCSVPTSRPRGCRRSWVGATPPPVLSLRLWRRLAPPVTTSSPMNSMGRRPSAR